MRNKLVFHLCAIVLLFIYTSNIQAQQRRILKSKHSKSFHFVFHYGNLGGVGFGCQYRWLSNLHIEVLGGIEAPGYILWSVPYTGHQYNIHGRLKFHIKPFLYACAGWYYGSYELTKDLDEVDFKIYHRPLSPTVSIGLNFFSQRMGFEIGAALDLPTTVIRSEIDNLIRYTIEAKRASDNFGKFFPFFVLRYDL